MSDVNKKENFMNATHLSALFMLIYIPFNSCQNTISQIQKSNGFGSIGFLLLGIFYVGKMGGSLCSNMVCSKIGR